MIALLCIKCACILQIDSGEEEEVKIVVPEETLTDVEKYHVSIG